MKGTTKGVHMTADYLPKWATLAEASEWLQARTGQPWPLPRLIEAGVMPHVWLTPDPKDSPNEAVMARLFDGRHEGFIAPLVFAGDTQRLAFARQGAMTMTRGPSGDLFRFTPGIPFDVAELRFAAEHVRRAAGDSAAPDEPFAEPIEHRQDRRLRRLRELGADRVWRRGEWKTTGTPGALKALCAEERAAQRRPFDEKRIREDLTEAAERERDRLREGKTAGPFAGLGG